MLRGGDGGGVSGSAISPRLMTPIAWDCEVLANAYGVVFLLNGGVAAILSVVVAAVLEAPILAAIWRVPFKRVLRWVLFANACSAVLGVFPVFFARIGQGPGMDADPWWVYQHYWERHLLDVCILFGISFVVELLCYLVVVWRSKRAIARSRMVLGVVVANMITYAIIGVIVARPPTTTGDYEFLSDTNWIADGNQRVWFVDPDSAKLMSIRLDGAERRIESDAKLGRLEKIWDVGSIYALIPGEHKMLLLTQNRQWVVVANGEARQLPGPVDTRRWARWEVAPLINQALGRIGNATTESVDGIGMDGVYYSGSGWEPWIQRDETMHLSVECATHWFDGSGAPLSVTEKPSGKRTKFKIPVGWASYACRDPVILPGERYVLFLCGDSVMVLDAAAKRVGRLVRGDSVVMEVEPFEKEFFNWQPTTSSAPASQP